MPKLQSRNKESSSLLENGNSPRTMIQNWAPWSLLEDSSQEDQKFTKVKISRDDQRILSMDVQSPQRPNWKTFEFDVFKEDTKAPAGSYQCQRQVKSPDINILNVSNAAAETPKQSTSYGNPFEWPQAQEFGKPYQKTTTTFANNQEVWQIPNEYSKISNEKQVSTQHQWIATAGSMFDPIAPSVPSSQREKLNHSSSLPYHQQTQIDFQNQFSDLQDSSNCREWKIFPPKLIEQKGEGLLLKSKTKNQNKKKKKKKESKKSEKKIKKIEISDDSVSSSRAKEPLAQTEKKEMMKEGSSPRTDALAELLRGTSMLKFSRRGLSSPHFKFVQLTRGKKSFYLQWFSKNKPLKATTIDLADMSDVLMGKDSNVVRSSSKYERFSFSIIYKMKFSLDLLAKSVDECTMWVKCLRELIGRTKMDLKLTCIQKVWINGLNYVDKNRPKRELKKPVLRANKVQFLRHKINHKLHKKNNQDVEQLRKRYKKLAILASNADVRNSAEHVNLMLSLAAIDERIEELVIETRDSRDPEMSNQDIARSNVDLETLEEKTKVLRKNKNFHLL